MVSNDDAPYPPSPVAARRPDERETFYEAQRRHRRAGWRFSSVAGTGVALTSLPVALVLSPPLTVLVLVVNDLLRTVLPLPDLVADVVDLAGHVLPIDGLPEPDQPLTVGLVAIVAALALLPGLMVVLAAWWTMRRVLRRSGAGAEAFVRAAGARPPRPGDPEERQLANLVEETAIAAGIAPPRLLLLDRDIVNAAVVGSSVADAALVVPRPLLDRLDRRATGALVAHLVATAVNGDLGMGIALATTTLTVDLLGAVVAAPSSRRARRLLRLLVAAARRPPAAAATDGARGDLGRTAREEAGWSEAHVLVDELVAIGNVEDAQADTAQGVSGWQTLAFPLLIARMALTLTQLVVLGLVINPIVALLWRRRRLLADASTVELIRDPDALVAVFEHMARRGTPVSAGPWSHVFVVGPQLRPEGDDRTVRLVGSSGSRPQARAGTGTVDMISYNPSVEQRLHRLAALGGSPETKLAPRQSLAARSPIGPFVYPLMLVLVPLLVVLMAVSVVCSLVMAGMAAALEYAVLSPLVVLAHTIAG